MQGVERNDISERVYRRFLSINFLHENFLKVFLQCSSISSLNIWNIFMDEVFGYLAQ